MTDAYTTLRQLAARAYQLRAATRAADRFIATQQAADRDTGSWLMSCAVDLAQDVAGDLDTLARELKDEASNGALHKAVQRLRVRAHQLHAASRAADHYLEQDSREDHDTGSWLIACACGVAAKLAAEVEDGASQLQRSPADGGIVDADEAALVRRLARMADPVQRVA